MTGRPQRLVAVVGTATEVGKTWVTARLAGQLAAAGYRVSARKPAQSFGPADDPARSDAAVLGRATGEPAEAVCPPGRWYGVAMAPPMAARALGRPGFTVADLVTEVAGSWPAGAEQAVEVGLVETAGGVRSPQADDGDAVDLLRLLSPDVVVLVADAGLGTINAVRLCVAALAGVASTDGSGATAQLVIALNRFDPDADLHWENREWLLDHDGLATLAVPGTEERLCRAVLFGAAGRRPDGSTVSAGTVAAPPAAPRGERQEAMQVAQVDDGDQEGGSQKWPEAVTPSERPAPGDVIRGSGARAEAEPLVGTGESTPLEEDEPEGVVPASPLWAMKFRRHVQWHLLPSRERHQRIRDRVGDGDDAVYVIDDGAHHVIVGRRVGAKAQECEYCLVGRQPRQRYDDLRDGALPPAAAFDGATEIALCGVAAEEGILSSNVFDVARYGDAAAVPARYRPGAPFISFDKALVITAD